MKKIILFFVSLLSFLGSYGLMYSQSNNNSWNSILIYSPNHLKNFSQTRTLSPGLIMTQFDYKHEVASMMIEDHKAAGKGVKTFSITTNTNLKENRLFNEAVALFEAMEFEKALKLFGKIHLSNSSDILTQYYLSLSQLYCGLYSPAITNFSRLNKILSLSQEKVNVEFLADVKFYFAISSMTLKDGNRISRILFDQLNRTGGKYEDIAKGMCAML